MRFRLLTLLIAVTSAGAVIGVNMTGRSYLEDNYEDEGTRATEGDAYEAYATAIMCSYSVRKWNGLNDSAQPVYARAYGWPRVALYRAYTPDGPSYWLWRWKNVALDTAIALGLVIGATVACEWLMRRKAPAQQPEAASA